MTLTPFLPELFFILTALCLLGASPLVREGRRRLQLAVLVLAAAGTAVSAGALGTEGEAVLQTYRFDVFSQLFKLLLAAGLLLTIALCGRLDGVDREHHPEFYALLFFCTGATMLLVSANHFLVLYLALELSSYCLYVLVAMRRERDVGLEAGLKYFLVGILASAAMLFGLALLYAATGTADVAGLSALPPRAMQEPLTAIGLLLTFSGLFFKLALVPFHFWAPDAYQGAPNQVTAYIATVSKVAAIAVFARVASATGGRTVYLTEVFFALSLASMTLGNLAAIGQDDLKRLLAYSTVAHAGYVLIGLLSFSAAGYSGAIFYAVALLAMKFSAFLVVVLAASDGRNLAIRDLAGLHRRSPLLAATLLVALLSLAGIPPTVGFAGKFLVFTAAMQKGHFALVLLAMVNVVVSLYYYLLVIRAAYLLEPEEELPPLRLSLPVRVLSLTFTVGMVAAGLFPYPVMTWAQAAARALP